MDILRSTVWAAAVLAAGCGASLGDPPGPAGSDATGTATGTGTGTGTSTGTGTGTGTGANGNSAGTANGGTGTGVTPGAGGQGNPAAGSPGTGGTGNPGAGGSSGATGANCSPSIPATSQIPRLTALQYDRTVRDLLGVNQLATGDAPSAHLATDQDGGLTSLAWANYKDVADKISAQVMADAALRANFLKCTPVAGDKTCLHNTVIQFGRRAFRRPLTDLEVARFDKVIDNGATITPSGKPEEVAQALLFMFLISPSFLQRAEITEATDGAGHFTLSSYEVASRLSYMLWGTIPDATLQQAADSGQLSTNEQIVAQAKRMLADPKAHQTVNDFHQAYLLMRAEGRWGKAQRDPMTFPTFKAAVVPLLTEETLKFFDKIAFTPGSTFRDFLASPLAFVNKDTAPLYGLDASKFGNDLTETMLDATTRPGFLTRLGFLVNFSSYTRTNPIYRGAFISKQVLGIAIPAPPPGAAETPLPSGTDLNTNRKQVDAQTSAANCIGCHHTYINPPGFVMEAFDAIGAMRTAEASGVALDTKADVTLALNAAPVVISTPAELMAKIAASPSAMRQYAKTWVGFAFARNDDPADACTVDQLAAKMASGSYPILDLFADITQTTPFRVRAVEVTQ